METTCKLVTLQRGAAALTGAMITVALACAGPKDQAGGSMDNAAARRRKRRRSTQMPTTRVGT